MDIFLAVLLFIVGLLLVIKGGDWFVDGAIWIAKKTHIPSLIIGATVVSIGTTIPEICVSTISVIKGLSNPALQTSLNEMAVGNAVGSMMCNTALILAIVLCIRPPLAEKNGFRSKAIYLTGATVLLIIFSVTGNSINVVEGSILLVLFVGFITMNVIEAIKIMKKGNAAEVEGEEEEKPQKPYIMILKLIVGAAAIGFGANFLVDKGQFLAEKMGIPTQIIAITFVAIGTSLPELVTSITALRKKEANIGIGNIIGANIINSTLLLGLASVIGGKNGLPIDYVTRTVAIFVLLAITLILVIPPFIKQKTYRWQGIVMLGLYFGFMAYNIYYVLQ